MLYRLQRWSMDERPRYDVGPLVAFTRPETMAGKLSKVGVYDRQS